MVEFTYLSWPLSCSFSLLCSVKEVFSPVPPDHGHFVPSHFILSCCLPRFVLILNRVSTIRYTLMCLSISTIPFFAHALNQNQSQAACYSVNEKGVHWLHHSPSKIMSDAIKYDNASIFNCVTVQKCIKNIDHRRWSEKMSPH